jgi:non-specific serine/threonine protein kinase
MHGERYSGDTLTAREQEILRLVALGLSNRDIAEELVVAPETIRWYTKQIYSKLGVHGRIPALVRAKELGLLEEAAVKTETETPLQQPLNYTLPSPPTPLIGRSQEIAEVKRLMQATRLLTLTGVGGTGKTRLALQAASEVLADFADGVYFVDLAPLSDAVLVAKAVAAGLGVIENAGEPLQDTLKRALAGREMLLLIDNFEHVIGAAPLISDLLAASPRLKALVTSREALRLSGEQEYPVPPLSLPSGEAVSIQDVTASEAGTLFVQRAQMIQPRFVLSKDNMPAVAQICARLDGLPLAIELAAARCKLLTPQALLERLDSRLNVLAGGLRDAPARQRTLRDTIEWSYNLLDEDEKTLFTRLAVFRGGRSLDAIEVVCGQDLSIDVLDGLASLVDKSLVQQKETAAGEPRFVMLETIHEYARERLEASGEAEMMQRRHGEYFVELAERAQPELRLAQHYLWSQRLHVEHDNLRVALEWCLRSGNITLGVRLASALTLFWHGFGHHVEGRSCVDQMIGRLDEAPMEYHARFLISAGHMYSVQHDVPKAQQVFKRALDISRQLGDKRRTAWSLIFLGYVMLGETDAAIEVVEEGLALFRELGHKPGIAQALNIVGEVARFGGEDARARRAYEECLVVSQETGETRRIVYVYYNLGFLAQHEGDHEKAKDLLHKGIQLARSLNISLQIAEGLAYLAGSIGAAGQPQRAARLLGAWEAALERMGAFPQPADKPEFDRIIANVRAQLDEATFEAAWAEGRKMTLEQAVAEALEESS